MKLLLTKDVPRLGIVGDVVDVAPGFARNYLLPNRLATQPTEANMRALAEERAKAEERRRLAREELRARAEKLADVEVTIAAPANQEGVLYGSVGPREIAAALREEGHDVESSQVDLRTPIRHLDNVLVDVVLAEEIATKVKVWVVRSGATEGEDEKEQAGGEETGAHGNDREA
jgi:large subunit ribosomal protein L9